MPLRRRASGLALALGVNLLLLFVLLGIGVMRSKPPKAAGTLVVDLLPESVSGAIRPRTPAARLRTPTRPVRPRPPHVMPVKPSLQPERPLDMIEMTKEDFAASDIGKLPKTGAGAVGDSEEVGRGPHGEILYAAEWARKPTDAELGGYVPANSPEGWGLIACRTIPGNRVDDCVELGNWPRGSRLASAVRQAAWQFRVKPPRKNGRTLVGEWVQIRIDYIHTRSN